MNVDWLIYSGSVGTGAAGLQSNVASVRYRMLVPMQALQSSGHEMRIVNIDADTAKSTVANALAGEVIVISKIMAPSVEAFSRLSEATFDVVAGARVRGQRVIADVSDNHFEHPIFGAHFRSLVNEVDLVVASTPGMAGIIAQHTPRPIQVISDPYEGPRGVVRFAPPAQRTRGLFKQTVRALFRREAAHAKLRLLWFGHGSNLDTLVDAIPEVTRLAARYIVNLHVVTAEQTNAAKLCETLTEAHAPLCTFHFSPWSAQTTWRALEACDVVIIPSKVNDSRKSIKSPNRLIEGLWAGRLVCSHPLPSYEEFRSYAWVGADLVAGIEESIANAASARRKIAAGQEYVAAHYSPAAIGRAWEAALRGATVDEALLRRPATEGTCA